MLYSSYKCCSTYILYNEESPVSIVEELKAGHELVVGHSEHEDNGRDQ